MSLNCKGIIIASYIHNRKEGKSIYTWRTPQNVFINNVKRQDESQKFIYKKMSSKI